MKRSKTKLNSLVDLDAYGIELLAEIQLKPSDKAVVIALSGDLGTGKTTLVQTIARDLGITEIVTSPTFVILKQYETTDKYFSQLIHLDAYRIEKVEEMQPLGFTTLLKHPNTLICIEWAERIKTLLPKETIWLKLETDSKGTHLISRHDNQ